jgi:hypothetical protein
LSDATTKEQAGTDNKKGIVTADFVMPFSKIVCGGVG